MTQAKIVSNRFIGSEQEFKLCGINMLGNTKVGSWFDIAFDLTYNLINTKYH